MQAKTKRYYPPHHKMTGVEIYNLRQIVKRICGAEDLVDFESLVDWDAEYWENKQTLLDYLKPGTCESQWGKTYTKFDQMAMAYYSEQEEQSNQEPEVEIESVAVTSEPVVTVRVTLPGWFRKVYLPAGNGEWLPVYVSGPLERVIRIPIIVRPSGHYRKI